MAGRGRGEVPPVGRKVVAPSITKVSGCDALIAPRPRADAAIEAAYNPKGSRRGPSSDRRGVAKALRDGRRPDGPPRNALPRRATRKARPHKGVALLNPDANAAGVFFCNRAVCTVVKPHALLGPVDDEVKPSTPGAWHIPRAGPVVPFPSRAV